MTPIFRLSILSLFLCISLLSCNKKESSKESIIFQKHKVPYVKKISYNYDIHGISMHDEYHWMQEKENSEVLAYLEEENKYLDSTMQYSHELQQKIYHELLERKTPEVTYLRKIENNVYYSLKRKGQEYPAYYKKSISNSAEDHILIDFNNYKIEDEFFTLGFVEVSPDQQHLAYAIKQEQGNEYSLIINNINNNTITDTIPGVSNSIAWAEDSQTIFYTTSDETGRANKVFNHKIYLPFEEDKLEYFEEDPDFRISVQKSKNNRFILINSESNVSSELHYLSADDPNQNFKLFSARKPGLQYEVFPHLNSFFILVKDDNSYSKLKKAVEGATDEKNWQPATIPDENTSIENIDVFKNYLVLFKSENGIPFIEIKDFNKNTTEQLRFEKSTCYIKPANFSTFNDEELYYEYESLLTPPSIFKINLKTKEKKSYLETENQNFIKDSFKSERIFVSAEDGTQIPVSLVYHKEIKKDGSAPLILYGYSSQEESPFPSQLSSMSFLNRISLLNRGFIFAIAHVRGSKDMGIDWNLKDKSMLKKHAINDYLACASYIIEQNYTSNDKIIAFSENAGAAVITAAVNLQPTQFKLVVIKNPKTDLLQIEADENRISFIEEFGDPEGEDAFNYLLSYSPYDNIEVKAYPNFFIFSDFHNNEIPYYEASKWTARLREYNTSQNTILLNTNFNPKNWEENHLKDVALEYSIILEQLGYKSVRKTVAEKQQ